MNWLDNLKRPDRTEEEWRYHPLTAVLTTLFAIACGFSLIWIFAFSDTVDERWQHAYPAFAVVVFLGTCLAFSKKKEDIGPLPLGIRKAVWWSILGIYAIVALAILFFSFSPYGHLTEKLRMICYIGSVSPLAYYAWHFLRQK